MYFFVRFMGIVAIVLGVMLMLFGVAATIYGFVQNAALVDLVNNYYLVESSARLTDARFYAALLGLILFTAGMITAAFGQLLLLFTDLAAHMRETNSLLRSMRFFEKNDNQPAENVQ